MKNLKNEKGIALVTALLLTLIALAMIMALLYMITWQTKLSAAHKRYKTTLEASQGSTEIFTKQILPLVFANHTTGGLAAQFPGLNLSAGSSNCLNAKLSMATAEWGAACGTGATSIDPVQLPDITLTLAGQSDTNTSYNVFTKIVDTVPGNSDLSGYEMLDSGAGVSGAAAGVSPKHTPAMYRIEVQGQMATNPQEKAKLSVLYAY